MFDNELTWLCISVAAFAIAAVVMGQWKEVECARAGLVQRVDPTTCQVLWVKP